MAWVYILKGARRHYLGSTVDLDARFAQHKRGHTYTTKRLGKKLEVVGSKEFATLAEARTVERMLKRKKNPKLAIYYLHTRVAPKAFGVGREFNSPPWHSPTLSVLKGRARDLSWGRELQP